MVKSELFGMFADEIAEAVKPSGLEKYRAKQIAEWMYQRYVVDFSAMTNLSLAQREILDSKFTATVPAVLEEQRSNDGKTSKLLLEYFDKATAETVLMRQPYGNSVCVSSQVGCGMGCVFCASTLNGLVRNLSGGEMLAQVLHIQALLAKTNEHVSNIVIMGSGEPLANYDNVLRFIRLCHEKYCLNLSYRSITLSTSGIVPMIDVLAAAGIPITLSISLHAPTDAIRSRLMPINEKYPLTDVVAAGGRFAAKTGRRVTYEYTLIANINDQDEHARELAGILKGQLANVNLIPVNSVVERGLLKPSNERLRQFEAILQKHGLGVTVRREMGADIQAACGQLRNQYKENNKQV